MGNTVSPMSFAPSKDDKKAIRRLSGEAETSMSDIVRAIVREYLSKYNLDDTVGIRLAVNRLTPFLDRSKTQSDDVKAI